MTKLIKGISKNIVGFCFIGLLLKTTPVLAFDIDNGKVLHNENCVRCHNESQYTRKDRKVTNYQELRERIMLCVVMLELIWFDEEIDDVAAYLNQTFYKYDLENPTATD